MDLIKPGTNRKWTKDEVILPIEDWAVEHMGFRPMVTNVKDMGMIALFDDRAYNVKKS